MLDLILNELSFRSLSSTTEPAAPDPETAKVWMRDFVGCLREGATRRLISGIRVDQDFVALELSPGYGLVNWRNDRTVDRDERTYFKSLATTQPNLTKTEQEVFFENNSSPGLACCFALDGIAISWTSNEIWLEPVVPVVLRAMNPDGELSDTPLELPNVSTVEHWDVHADWIRQTLLKKISSGEVLLFKAADIFPHLEFCRTAVKQIERLSGNERHFPWIVSSLMAAEIESAKWTDGEFHHARLPGPATGESESVHKDKRLRQMRTFTTLDGETLVFDYHMKNNSENIRIHYLFQSHRYKLVIGYVGEHLETANF